MIILMGVKHSGKTTLGKKLAQELNLPFWDLDNLLEKQYSGERSLTFREIYYELGEDGFRELEYRAAKKIDIEKEGILALGGGTIENTRAVEIIKKAEVLVFLDTDEAILFDRIKNRGIPSFLLDSPKTLFHELFIRRRKLYTETADVILELKDENVETVLSLLKKAIEDIK